MSKESRYIYNPEKASYDLYVPSNLTKWTRFGIVVLIGLAFFFSYFWIWNGVMKKSTPKTAILERQNKVLLASIEEMNERMDAQSSALSQLQERDNVVYRSVFGMDEVPKSVRNAGFGGVDRYADLKVLGFKTVAMALTDKSISLDDPVLKQEPRLALVMGTEGDGLAHEVIADCDYVVRIPMAHGVDSLNVAAASAVAFWELRNR